MWVCFGSTFYYLLHVTLVTLTTKEYFDVCALTHRGALWERDGLTWLVFINLNFEMRFDNFTRETCILYIDLLETLNFQLRYLFEKVARINNRKTVVQIP